MQKQHKCANKLLPTERQERVTDSGDFGNSTELQSVCTNRTNRNIRNRKKNQRGFVQVLLLVFLILGVSMWGISEILQRAEESVQNKRTAEIGGLNAARTALFDYAIYAPERLNIESRAGRYAALIYENGETRPNIPYRYFSFPCPDVAFDGRLDSVADFFRGNALNSCRSLDLRTQGLGRLPWRDFSDEESGAYRYVHGIGNHRLSDNYGNLFWYLPSPNLTPSDVALNPHWIMRRTTNWITIKREDTVVAKNVAAIVIAPGDRIPENATEARVPDNGNTNSRPNEEIAEAYLEDGVLQDVLEPLISSNIPGFTISIAASVEVANAQQSNDRIAYITREELADISGAGVRSLTEGKSNIYDQISGQDNYFGVQEMLEAHFRRFEHLPPPAVFNSGNAEQKERLPDLSSMTQGTCGPTCATPPNSRVISFSGITLRIGSISDASNVTVTALLPARNLRKVYLQPGAYLAAEESERYDDGLPPYNIALYEMDTALNRTPLPTTYVATLTTEGFYPHRNLFGVRHSYSDTAGNSPAVSLVGHEGVALRDRVYVRSQTTLDLVEFAQAQGVRVADITLALAEPVRAYISGEQLQEKLNLPRVSSKDIPRYGIQVQLPVGTQVRTHGSSTDNISLRVPAGLRASVVYDSDNQGYRLTRPLQTPVEWIDRTDRMLTVSLVLSRLPIVSGDSGFLPVDDYAVEHLDTDGVFQMDSTSFIATANIDVPGKDQRYRAPTGPFYPEIIPFSNVPVDLDLYTDHRLIVVPFPPAGRPFVGTVSTALANMPSPMFINYIRSATAERTFTLPAGAQIIYPQNANFSVGVDFTFPENTRALLPPGTVLTVELLPDSTLPNGSTVAIPVGNMLVTQAVTLYHGGYLNLYGEPSIEPTVNARGTRVVLQDGVGIASEQELFDIEVQAPYRVAGNAHGRDGTEVVQPLTGRRQVYRPIVLPDDGRIRTGSRIPMRFMTRPRALAMFSGVEGNLATRFTLTSAVGEEIVRAGGGSFVNTLQFTSTLEVNRSPWVSNIEMGSQAVSVRLVGQVADGGTGKLGREADYDITIDEQTRFLLPADAAIDDLYGEKMTIISPNGLPDRVLLSTFILPVGTGIYDPELDLSEFNIGSGAATTLSWPVLAPPNPLTLTLVRPIPEGGNRGVVSHQLVMMPETDMAIGTERIPANSVVDVNQLVAWPPNAVHTIPTAAEDLRAVSQGPIYLYFPSAVTLVPARERRISPRVNQPGLGGQSLRVDNTLPPSSFRFISGAAQDLDVSNTAVDIVPGDAEVTEAAFTLSAQNLVLPAGTFLIINEGEELDYFSYNRDGNNAALVDADYSILPEDSVVVFPPRYSFGVEPVVNTYNQRDLVPTLTLNPGTPMETILGYQANWLQSGFCVDGNNNLIPPEQLSPNVCFIRGSGVYTLTTFIPATSDTADNAGMYLRFLREGGSGSYALVDDITYTGISPLVYYTHDAYLVDTERGEDYRNHQLVASVPGGGRGDLYGNVTYRDGYDFAANMLPVDTAEFLRNFPMIYAVAPECRFGRGGKDCAEDEGEGLEFSIDGDESWVLKNSLEASGRVYITAVSPSAPSDPNVRLNVFEYGDAGYIADINSPVSTMTVEYVYSDTVGGDTFVGADISGVLQGTAGLQLGKAYVARLDENAPPDTVMRVYVSLSSPPQLVAPSGGGVALHRISTQLLEDHYAELQQITLYPGGYVNGEREAAHYKLNLAGSFDNRGVSPVKIGVSARISNVRGSVDDLFGWGGSFRSGGVDIPLDDYRVADNNQLYEAQIFSGGRYSEVGDNGVLESRYLPGDEFLLIEEAGRLSRGNVASAAEVVLLTNHSSFVPRQGYLWQGYVNVGRNAVNATLRGSQGASVSFGRVRVHSMFSDELNFFGSGVDFPEFLDSRSPVRMQSPAERMRFWMDQDRTTQYGNAGFFGSRAEDPEDFVYLVNRYSHDFVQNRSQLFPALGYERLGVDEWDDGQGNTTVNGSEWELRIARSFAGRMYPVDRPFGLRAPVASSPVVGGVSRGNPDIFRRQEPDGTYTAGGMINSASGVQIPAGQRVRDRRIWLIGRVRNRDGTIRNERVTMQWTPRAVGIKRGGSWRERWSGPQSWQRNREAQVYENYLQIGVSANPYAIHDQLWFNPNDTFAYRQLLDLADPSFYFDRDRNPPPANWIEWTAPAPGVNRAGLYNEQENNYPGTEVLINAADTMASRQSRLNSRNQLAPYFNSQSYTYNTRHAWKSFDTNARLQFHNLSSFNREARFNVPPYQMVARMLARNYIPSFVSADAAVNPERGRARIPVVTVQVDVCPNESYGVKTENVVRIPGVALGPGFDAERIYAAGTQRTNCKTAEQLRSFSFSSRPRRNRFLLDDVYSDQIVTPASIPVNTITMTAVVVSQTFQTASTTVSTQVLSVDLVDMTVSMLTVTTGTLIVTATINTFTLDLVTIHTRRLGTLTLNLGPTHMYRILSVTIMPPTPGETVVLGRGGLLRAQRGGTDLNPVEYRPPITLTVTELITETEQISVNDLSTLSPPNNMTVVQVPVTSTLTVVTVEVSVISIIENSSLALSTITLYSNVERGRSRQDVSAGGEVRSILDNTPSRLNPNITDTNVYTSERVKSYTIPRPYQPLKGNLYFNRSFAPRGQNIYSGPPYWGDSPGPRATIRTPTLIVAPPAPPRARIITQTVGANELLGDKGGVFEHTLHSGNRNTFTIPGGDFFFYLDMAYNTQNEGGRTEDFRDSRSEGHGLPITIQYGGRTVTVGFQRSGNDLAVATRWRNRRGLEANVQYSGRLFETYSSGSTVTRGDFWGQFSDIRNDRIRPDHYSRQAIWMGDNFAIGNPEASGNLQNDSGSFGAIVPHFGGRNLRSVADVYAARAHLFYNLLGANDDELRLQRIYGQPTYQCPDNIGAGVVITTSYCPEMYNPNNVQYWLPILTGVYAFEKMGLKLVPQGLQSPDVRLVVPEPEIEIVHSGGTREKFPAGSILFPMHRLTTGIISPRALRAKKIEGNGRHATLHIYGNAVAAVDVSPVHTPKAVYFWRGRPAIRSHDFVFSPVKTWDNPSTPAEEDDHIVEPMYFTQDEIIDFRFYYSGFGGRYQTDSRSDNPNHFVPDRVAPAYRQSRSQRQNCPQKFWSYAVSHHDIRPQSDPFGGAIDVAYEDTAKTRVTARGGFGHRPSFWGDRFGHWEYDPPAGASSLRGRQWDPARPGRGGQQNNFYFNDQATCIEGLIGLVGEGIHEIGRRNNYGGPRVLRSTSQEKRVDANQIPATYRYQTNSLGFNNSSEEINDPSYRRVCSSNEAANYENGCEGFHLAYDVRDGGSREVIRHDGTWSRGFLMNDRVADIMSDYFSGLPVFTPDNGFITYFPRRFFVPDNNLIWNASWGSNAARDAIMARLGLPRGTRNDSRAYDGEDWYDGGAGVRHPMGPCMWFWPFAVTNSNNPWGATGRINYNAPSQAQFRASASTCAGEPSTYQYGYPSYDFERVYAAGTYRQNQFDWEPSSRDEINTYDIRTAFLPQQQGAYITQPKVSKDHHDPVDIFELLNNAGVDGIAHPTMTLYGRQFDTYNVPLNLQSRTSQRRLPMYRPDLVPVDNQTEHVGNPLSWHWLNRDPGPANLGSFIPLGGARMFPIKLHPYVYMDVPQSPRSDPGYDAFPAGWNAAFRGVYTGRGCGTGHAGIGSRGGGSKSGVPYQWPPNHNASMDFPDNPEYSGFANTMLGTQAPASTSNAFRDVPCSGRFGPYWVGVRAATSASSAEYPHPTVTLQTDDNDFFALRLPHRIDLTAGMMTIFTFQGTTRYGGAPPYPVTLAGGAGWLRFPPNTHASILQVDGASWESAHPYVARFMAGAVIANDGGLYPRQQPFIDTSRAGIDTERARRVLSTAEEFTVPLHNEGTKRVDISGRALMHYTRSETLPGNHAFSNTPVYTNMWIRLPMGGRVDYTDTSSRQQRIILPPNTIVNPVMGTYLPGESTASRANVSYSNYPFFAEVTQIEVARPLLVLPKGTTMHIGTSGGRITNVKAAAIFSIAPLDRAINCSYGGVTNNFLSNGVSRRVDLSQLRDGVDESKYAAATEAAAAAAVPPVPASEGRLEFTLGNPCAWLEDHENTDGDRFYIYRNRRRYLEPARTRIISNDRTYLLGGKLQLS